MRISFSGRGLLALPILAAAGLAACSGGAEHEAGAFEAACNEAGTLTPEICACLEGEARNLSADTYAFVIASIAENEEEARRLVVDLDQAEQDAAASFISRGIQSCIIDLPDMAAPAEAATGEAPADAAASADAAAPAEEAPAAE